MATIEHGEEIWRGALRFLLEVAIWIAIYFAWGILALAIAVAALALLSVPGDRHRVVAPVSGRFRLGLELAAAAAGIWAAYVVGGPVWGAILLGLALLVALTGRQRFRWLASR